MAAHISDSPTPPPARPSTGSRAWPSQQYFNDERAAPSPSAPPVLPLRSSPTTNISTSSPLGPRTCTGTPARRSGPQGDGWRPGPSTIRDALQTAALRALVVPTLDGPKGAKRRWFGCFRRSLGGRSTPPVEAARCAQLARDEDCDQRQHMLLPQSRRVTRTVPYPASHHGRIDLARIPPLLPERGPLRCADSTDPLSCCAATP